MADLEHHHENGENRGNADEDWMMRDVLEQLTHVRGSVQAGQRIPTGVLWGAARSERLVREAAEYSSGLQRSWVASARS